MFCKDCTSSIMDFINSILRADKHEDYKELLNEARDEIKSRVPLAYKCYEVDEKLN